MAARGWGTSWGAGHGGQALAEDRCLLVTLTVVGESVRGHLHESLLPVDFRPLAGRVPSVWLPPAPVRLQSCTQEMHGGVCPGSKQGGNSSRCFYQGELENSLGVTLREATAGWRGEAVLGDRKGSAGDESSEEGSSALAGEVSLEAQAVSPARGLAVCRRGPCKDDSRLGYERTRQCW